MQHEKRNKWLSTAPTEVHSPLSSFWGWWTWALMSMVCCVGCHFFWISMFGWIGLTSLAPYLAWTSMPCPLPGRCWLMSYHITSYHFLLTLQTIEYGAVWFKVGIENLRIGKGRGPSFFSGCWCTEQDDLERRKRAVGSQDIVDFRYRSFPDFLLLKPS